MNNTTLLERFQQHKKTIADEEAKLVAEFEKDLETKLKEAAQVFSQLPKVTRDLFWTGPRFADTLKALGLAWVPFASDETDKPTRKSGGARKIKIPELNVTHERILEVLAGGRELMRKELIAELDTTGTTLDPKKDELLASGKIAFKQEGTKKLYYATGK